MLNWKFILRNQGIEPGMPPDFALLYRLAIHHLSGKSKKDIYQALCAWEEFIIGDSYSLKQESYQSLEYFSYIVKRRVLPSKDTLAGERFHQVVHEAGFSAVLKACDIEMPVYIDPYSKERLRYRDLIRETELVRRLSQLYPMEKGIGTQATTSGNRIFSFFQWLWQRINEGGKYLLNQEISADSLDWLALSEKMTHIILHPYNDERSMTDARRVMLKWCDGYLLYLRTKQYNPAENLFDTVEEKIKRLHSLGLVSIKKAFFLPRQALSSEVFQELVDGLLRLKIQLEALSTIRRLHGDKDDRLAGIMHQFQQTMVDWDGLLNDLAPHEQTKSPHRFPHSEAVRQYWQATKDAFYGIKKEPVGANEDVFPESKASGETDKPTPTGRVVYLERREEESAYSRSMRERKEEEADLQSIFEAGAFRREAAKIEKRYEELLQKSLEAEQEYEQIRYRLLKSEVNDTVLMDAAVYADQQATMAAVDRLFQDLNDILIPPMDRGTYHDIMEQLSEEEGYALLKGIPWKKQTGFSTIHTLFQPSDGNQQRDAAESPSERIRP